MKMEQPNLVSEVKWDTPDTRREYYIQLSDGGICGRSCLGVGGTEASAKKRAIANLELILSDLKGVPRA